MYSMYLIGTLAAEFAGRLNDSSSMILFLLVNCLLLLPLPELATVNLLIEVAHYYSIFASTYLYNVIKVDCVDCDVGRLHARRAIPTF